MFTLALLFESDSMSLFNMSLHVFHSFKLFTTMRARVVLFSWLLKWILDWDLMDFSHVSFEVLGSDWNFAHCTISHRWQFWLASLASAMFYKLLPVRKLFLTFVTVKSFPMSPQLMIPQ